VDDFIKYLQENASTKFTLDDTVSTDEKKDEL
jgi:hypothetical protein